ncbi:hypothetical protein D3C78_500430 [compost metagenome]
MPGRRWNGCSPRPTLSRQWCWSGGRGASSSTTTEACRMSARSPPPRGCSRCWPLACPWNTGCDRGGMAPMRRPESASRCRPGYPVTGRPCCACSVGGRQGPWHRPCSVWPMAERAIHWAAASRASARRSAWCGSGCARCIPVSGMSASIAMSRACWTCAGACSRTCCVSSRNIAAWMTACWPGLKRGRAAPAAHADESQIRCGVPGRCAATAPSGLSAMMRCSA